MTAAEKLRMEIAQEAPFSKDEFISKISRLIKAYGYASFICDKHIRETDVSPNGNTIRMAHEQVAGGVKCEELRFRGDAGCITWRKVTVDEIIEHFKRR